MWSKLLTVAALSWMLVVPIANADGTVSDLAPVDEDEWGIPLTDNELADLRGGFNGLAFNIAFSGFVDKLGNGSGNLTVGQNGAIVPGVPPDVTVKDGEVRISTGIGNFQGANGIFQIAQVPGNFNVVNNNLYVQIALINLIDPGTQVPNLASLFGTPR
ncbi:MAG: hypothetical protein E8D41_00485 [Nitrospira sp.]|nr:MAG: hypothetical protein E8D41_00485 [Nitrospira sp.]